MKFQQPALLELPKFKTALEYRDKFTFGHEKIDSILELHLGHMIGIFGETKYSNALATRLIVRSLLPRNHGGVNAEKVIVIDADNSSSPYLYVDIARQYGMHHSKVLRNVVVSRQFTIYQLTNTIIYDLPRRVQIHKPKELKPRLIDQLRSASVVTQDEKCGLKPCPIWLKSQYSAIPNLDVIGKVPFSTSILILNGKNDSQTPIQHALLLQQKLMEVGHPDHTLITYPDLGHLFYPSSLNGSLLLEDQSNRKY